ncbi:FKBP12-associated protein [Toensbergia leucococca]|nr:FKBP12-associated protein [Toensbergia leucococca]
MASVDSGPPVPSQATSHHTPRPRRNWRKPQRSHDQVPAPHDNRHDLRNTQTQEEGQDNNQPRGVALLASIPAPIIPLSEPSSQDLSSTETSSGETGIPRGTSGRGMRGQERGGNYFGQGHEGKSRGSVEEGVSGYIPQNQGLHPSTRRGMMTGPGRQFGGRLTTEPEANTTSRLTSSLQADAPEFRPGRPHAHRPAPGKAGKPPPPAQRHMQGRGAILRRGSSLKSTAPDIPTRTHEDIANGLNGPQTKVPLWLLSRHRMEMYLHQGNGDVLDVICQRMSFLLRTHVGVRKRLIRELSLDFLHIHVDKHAANIEDYQENAHILVNYRAMLAHALHVHTLVPFKVAFAVN